MKGPDGFLEQMTTDIHDGALGLDDVRRCLFLHWLSAHNGGIQPRAVILREAGNNFKPALLDWLASLSVQGALWEYRLIMEELAWWRDLDEVSLCRLMEAR